jgi:hypothetical protein
LHQEASHILEIILAVMILGIAGLLVVLARMAWRDGLWISARISGNLLWEKCRSCNGVGAVDVVTGPLPAGTRPEDHGLGNLQDCGACDGQGLVPRATEWNR